MPIYQQWRSEIERFPIFEDSILVGHSCGGGFLLRWLSETKRKVARTVLVAPWLDPKRYKTQEFFDFEIDPKLASRIDVHLLESSNDAKDIQDSIGQIRAVLPGINYHLFENYGHFCYSDMQTTEFPELKMIALNGNKFV